MYNEIMFTRLNKLIFTNKIDLKFPGKVELNSYLKKKIFTFKIHGKNRLIEKWTKIYNDKYLKSLVKQSIIYTIKISQLQFISQVKCPMVR